MTTRERLLIALNNGKPDRLPVQVHGWMGYYLDRYLGGVDQWQAYDRFGMDKVIYGGPASVLTDKQKTEWVREDHDAQTDADGTRTWRTTIHTPEGDLTLAYGSNEITTWETEHPLKTERDFELFEKYAPVPIHDWTGVREIRERVGDDGISRTGAAGYGQGSPWQDLCTLTGTVPAIMIAMDEPNRMHHMLSVLLDKRLETIEKSGSCHADIIECGGGAGSDTVISPKLHEEFCLPYDKKQHDAIHAKSPGIRIVYHLCGGLMNMLDIATRNGADGLETMTPPGMGGNADLAEATRRVGEKLFFIGGFDQQAGFERGSPEATRRLVLECHAACPDGGYICCPSDHFFHGSPECVQAFVDAAKECTYD